MQVKSLILGESYRHKTTPTYGWAKVVKVLKPKEGVNPHPYIIIECEWSVYKNDRFGLIKHFRPSDLIPDGQK